MTRCPSYAELGRFISHSTETIGDPDMDPVQWAKAHQEACPVCHDIAAHLEGCEACRAALGHVRPGRAGDEGGGCLLPDPSLPDSPPGYRIVKRLGAGAYGEVWLAEDLDLPRHVALKSLRVRLDAEDRVRALEHLREEAELLVELDHEHIVRVYGWKRAGAEYYLVEQYVSGGSLADLLRGGPLDWREAAGYVADVAEGLVEVHALDIVHRDIKPSNILTKPTRSPWYPSGFKAVLIDFSIATRLPALAGRRPLGTPRYMAPEAFDGEVTKALDVYGLAATLFHLVTGTPPFPGTQLKELLEQIRKGLSPSDIRWGVVPEPLERVIRDGLAAEPGHRPGLVEFGRALRVEYNHLLADAIPLPNGGMTGLPPTDLRLVISRRVGPDEYRPVATASQPAMRVTRDASRVPRSPERARLQTGDRARVEVTADRAGYVTVFNIGPTGNLDLLYPEELPRPGSSPAVPRPRHIIDVELEPPTGRERMFAIWSRRPLPLSLEELHGLVDEERSPGSRPYRTTRDMRRILDSVHRLPPDDWCAVVLELDHTEAGGEMLGVGGW